MRRDTVVGHSAGHPHGTLLILTLAYHLHNPHFARVGNGERLPLTLVAVVLHKRCHCADGLAGRARTLQCYLHQTAVVKNAVLAVPQFLTPLECRLKDGELEFVGEPHHLICFTRLGDFAEIVTGVVVIYRTHLAFLVLSAREEEEIAV